MKTKQGKLKLGREGNLHRQLLEHDKDRCPSLNDLELEE